MAVGGFPGLSDINRRTIRGPVNPLDKTTVVSIFPKDIFERKPTIQPGEFKIPAGSYDKPSVLVVGPSSWWREIDESQPLLEIPNSSIQIADSIVKDFCNGLVGCDMGESMPGLFYVPGEFTVTDIKTKHKLLLDRAKVRQERFWKELITLADIGWAGTSGNPLSISDDMRLAARELGVQGKDWMSNFEKFDMVRCIACGALRNPNFPVCGSCHAVVDTEKAKALGLVFAK